MHHLSDSADKQPEVRRAMVTFGERKTLENM
jgi:hypothetical protein